MKIERTLFWFKDGSEMLVALNEDFFGLGTLLNRLLNERYDGRKIEFINIDFATDKTYNLYPALPKEQPYYYGGHLRYYGVFNKEQFNELSWSDQKKYVWGNAHEYLVVSSESTKNKKLLEAAHYAYNRGLELNLNPDYRIVESDIYISGELFKASVWVNFKADGMYSKFTLEKNGIVVFDKNIDKSKKGIEFFLEMYKGIKIDDNNIVITGSKDVEYLPLNIPFDKVMF